MDLSVQASVKSSGVAFHVHVDVAGLPAGHTATLRMTSDGPAVALVLDHGCSPLELGEATCAVTPGSTSYKFHVVPAQLSPVTLTFTVVPDGDAVESDPSDNTATVVLTR